MNFARSSCYETFSIIYMKTLVMGSLSATSAKEVLHPRIVSRSFWEKLFSRNVNVENYIFSEIDVYLKKQCIVFISKHGTVNIYLK